MKIRKITCVETYLDSLVTPEFVAEISRVIDARMIAEWGERCDDYEPGCACCEAWTRYDRTGKVPRSTKRFAEFCSAQSAAAETKAR